MYSSIMCRLHSVHYLSLRWGEVHGADLILDQLLPRAELDANVDELTIMKAWINECTESHPNCVADAKPFRPTRLLDLDALGDSWDVVLIRWDWCDPGGANMCDVEPLLGSTLETPSDNYHGKPRNSSSSGSHLANFLYHSKMLCRSLPA